MQIKRDKDSGGPPETQLWGQPKVKLERLGLVEDFEKRPKPVVLVKKLSVEQIQRIIRHSRSGKNRISSGKSGKSKTRKSFTIIHTHTKFPADFAAFL